MKASEVREMSIADLRERIELEKANLDTMKVNHTISPLEDTSKIAKEALRLGAQKLPVTTKFVVRRDYVE